ncbi:hypothetical protein WA158_008223 [Blastocystis sp. Blastoise]
MPRKAEEKKVYYLPALKHNIKAINIINDQCHMEQFQPEFITKVSESFPEYTKLIVYDNLAVAYIYCSLENYEGKEVKALPVGKKNLFDIQLHIKQIAVLPTYQRYNIASIALNHIIEESKKCHLVKRAVTEFKVDDNVSRSFFEHNKFDCSSSSENTCHGVLNY